VIGEVMTEQQSGKRKVLFIGIAIALATCVSFIPPPGELTPEAMRFAGIFIAMIFVLISRVIADWLVVVSCTALLAITKVSTIPVLFASFHSTTLWLIIMVFALAAGIGNSGLLKRIGLKVLSFFPASYRGAVTALMASGLLVGPLIPSVNAKVNILIPISTAITEEMGLKEKSKGALGLFSATYLTVMLGGNAFITGSVYVAVMIGFIGANFTMGTWFIATSVWLVVLLVFTYIYCAHICKPEETKQYSKDYFKNLYKELGPMSNHEKITLGLLVVALVVWTTSSLTGIDTGMFGLLIVAVLIITNIMDASEFQTKVPWTLIVFIGCLLGMASMIAGLGWDVFIASILGGVLSPVVGNPWIFVGFLCIFTFLLRFVIIEQITCLLITIAIFGPFMEAAGISMFVLVFVQFMSSMVWNVPFQNPFPLATIQIAGGKYVTFNELRKTSVMYMVTCTVGMLASVPLWMQLGLLG
jgi:DASS family divalent anion:Na+ symporter